MVNKLYRHEYVFYMSTYARELLDFHILHIVLALANWLTYSLPFPLSKPPHPHVNLYLRYIPISSHVTYALLSPLIESFSWLEDHRFPYSFFVHPSAAPHFLIPTSPMLPPPASLSTLIYLEFALLPPSVWVPGFHMYSSFNAQNKGVKTKICVGERTLYSFPSEPG